jgi:diapolycopene oxygenase
VKLNSEVTEVRKEGSRVTGIVTKDDQFHAADILVSNMEVTPAYERVLREDAAFLRSLDKFEPACSGLVLELGLDCQYPQLAHHNFLFSGDQKAHFHTVFRKRQLPPVRGKGETMDAGGLSFNGHDTLSLGKLTKTFPYLIGRCRRPP